MDAPYYNVKDYACSAGYGAGWSEAITAITNRATYTLNDALPSGGTDYFTRIREGASDYEWITWNAVLEKPGATNDVSARLELVGDHQWRYHYYVSTNDVAEGAVLRFHFTGKRVFTNEVPFTFACETNTWYSSDPDIQDIPFTATLGGTRDATLALDAIGTHLLFEVNEANADRVSFSVSHATYQDVNMWTDATDGYRGSAVATNLDGSVTSDVGVSDAKAKFEPEFALWKTCPFMSSAWEEAFTTEDRVAYPLDTLFSNHSTPNGWTGVSARFVPGARQDTQNLAIHLTGGGDGALTMENFNKSTVPPGLDSVSFTARVAQQHAFNNFAWYEDGTSMQNYGFSARMMMSRKYNSALGTNPDDISPVYPSVSLVGYYRPTKGCYEFRVTRTGQNDLTCALYKWSSGDSSTTATLLTSNILHATANSTPGKTETGANQPVVTSFQASSKATLLVPTSSAETGSAYGSYGYIMLYTDANNHVHIECALSNNRVPKSTTIAGDRSNVRKVLTWVDTNPGKLVKGSYGIGSVDCQALFGSMAKHDLTSANALNFTGTCEYNHLSDDEWAFYSSRWANLAGEEITGLGQETAGLKALIPENQTVKVYLADANQSGQDANWLYSGYEVAVPSFSTNRFTVSPQLPGLWKVRLQTGGTANDDVKTDVVLDDVIVTPWQGISNGDAFGANVADPYSSSEWVYTKAWIASSADIVRDGKDYGGYELRPAGTNGYVFIFNEPGAMISFTPKMDMEIDRILLVGGGGAGGWTLGGGGGGGGVLEYDFGTNTLVVAQGEKIDITVGKGGDNFYVNKNDSTYWKAGGAGGSSSISSPTINMAVPGGRVNTPLSVKGGGGGAGWNQRKAADGNATGGGAAQGNDNAYYTTRATGTAGQGNSGGRAYGDRAGGGGGASLNEDGMGQDANATDNKAGDGGAGRASDITGEVVYYGGGGGGGGGDGNKTPNSAYGGAGGLGGGGKGPPAKAAVADRAYMDGTDGLGGGGAGGSHSGAAGTNAGGKGGSGTVIIRCRSASKSVTLQPARVARDTSGTKDPETGKFLIPPLGLRSPYIDNGLSMFTFSYANADTNCVLLVQIATNMIVDSPVYNLTFSSATNTGWTTLRKFDFANDPELKTDAARKSGTLTTFLSLRTHLIYDEMRTVCGVMRVIVDPAVVEKVVENTEAVIETQDSSHRLPTSYGAITITRAYCYNEPPLDTRSWWGWNVHTEGWDSSGTPGPFAYLTDWPRGMSLSLNFSSKETDNNAADALGIGLGEKDPGKIKEYAANNPFVQSPEMVKGVGSVMFRARLFDTNAAAAVISLYGSSEPSTDQPTVPAAWGSPITNFVVTSPTYQTFSWRTTEDKTNLKAVRLEMAGARHGRNPSNVGSAWQTWEKPANAVQPIQRVFIDEISVGEPISPRLALRHCRPFRTNLRAEDICVVTNIDSMDQQPILGESWGVQVQVEPQQMTEELVEESIEVHLSVLRGATPWGYDYWKTASREQLIIEDCVLPRVSPTELIFRSHFSVPGSIVPPEETPNTYYQYKVWVTYLDKTQLTQENPTPHSHTIDAADWSAPAWYWGGRNYNELYPDRFAAFTILDSISPRRAWINEVDFWQPDGTSRSTLNQFVEFAVPQGADLTGWRLEAVNWQQNSYEIARFGLAGAAGVTTKYGTVEGKDFLKDAHYTFVALKSPVAGNSVTADGTWSDLTTRIQDPTNPKTSTTIGDYLQMQGGAFRETYPYGLRLVRPSGIIEHEVVVQGTNTWAGWSDGGKRSGTNLVAQLRRAQGERATWIYAGEDTGPGSVGVVKSHGEYGEYPNDPALNCWKNGLTPTPAALNEGQDFPLGYFLEPNGTNIWIYANVTGTHIDQIIGGMTNKSAVIIVQKGMTTGITYRVENWYETADCRINGNPFAAGDGHAGLYTLDLGAVEETTTVEMGDTAQSRLRDLGVDPANRYYSAIMRWLTSRWPDANSEDITLAQYQDLRGQTNGTLSLTGMYWLDIPPVAEAGQPATKGENWVLRGGMGRVASPSSGEPGADSSVKVVESTDADGMTHKDVELTLTLMISNRVDNSLSHAPSTLQGVAPDSSTGINAPTTNRWDGPTLKITGALRANGVSDEFRPLREFMLCEKSFNAKGTPNEYTTTVRILDPQTWKSSPGWFYGWHDFPAAPVWYGFRINDESIGYTSVEMLDENTRVTE